MKPRTKPIPLLGKSHAHRDKTKYKRCARDGSWQKEIEAGLPHMKVINLNRELKT